MGNVHTVSWSFRFSMQKIFRKVPENLKADRKERSFIDRRSGVDRRTGHNPDYSLSGGKERSNWKERRSGTERRKDWMRVNKCVSVFVPDLEREIAPGMFDI